MTEETKNTPVQDTPSAVPEESAKADDPPTPSTPLESTKPVDPPAPSTPSPSPVVESTPADPAPAAAPSTVPPSSSPKPPPASTESPAEPTASLPNPPASPAPTPPTSSKPKPKSKPRRARPRRRGAGDSDSEDEAAHSDSSLTTASGSDPADSEDEEDAPSSKPSSKPNGEKGKQPAAFPDSLSTTPAAWADEKLDGDEIIFADFNDGDSKKPVQRHDGEKRVYTEEQTRRYEERKARMKEKQKARRAELKEAKRKEREGGKEEPKGKVEELVASTSALALDDPSSQRGVELLPSSQTPRNQRPDPKVIPRAGGFRTHDQRQDVEEEQFDYGRGRGRGFRGGFRGRGRGFPPDRGGFAQGGGRGQELTVDEPRGKKMSGEEGELEMDKLWAEMEAKEKARAERAEREAQEAEHRAEAKGAEEVMVQAASTEDTNGGEEPVEPHPRVNGSGRKDKWGHEGYESMSAVDQFQANRGPIRGRGRGRGMFGPVSPRGLAHPFRGRFHPAFRPPFAAPTGPRVTHPQPAAPSAAIAPPPTIDRTSPVRSSEATITQAGVDDLLAPPTQSVTVRLPGGIEQVVEKPEVIYSSPPAPQSSGPLLNGATEFIPARTPIPEFIPSANPSPVPIAVQHFTGSDHGSMSSGGPTTAVPAASSGYFPQGMVGPNGEYFANGEYQRQFYPQRYSHQQASSGQFYPQSFSPDHFASNGQSHAQHPSLGSRASFPSPGQYYQDGRASPYFAPSPMGQPNGFFVPPRSSKVSIRAPVEETEESKAERAAFRQRIQQGQGSQAYAGAYNPYASVNGNGYTSAVANGANGEDMINGANGETVYYNQWQGHGPYVQGGYEYTEYGY